MMNDGHVSYLKDKGLTMSVPGQGTFISASELSLRAYSPQYFVTKTYGHDLGLSTAFRQWRAASHCQFVHGYSLAVELTFVANSLDSRNWVIDFGGLSDVKDMLKAMFDHKLLVAKDDPQRDYFLTGGNLGVFSVEVVPNVGCESFAQMVYEKVEAWLNTYAKEHITFAVSKGHIAFSDPKGHWNNVRLDSVKVSEHGANSATYRKNYV
jgi:6-pyruvoyltetrahydropterin/6-carboxytetrahydropterin synthase